MGSVCVSTLAARPPHSGALRPWLQSAAWGRSAALPVSAAQSPLIWLRCQLRLWRPFRTCFSVRLVVWSSVGRLCGLCTEHWVLSSGGSLRGSGCAGTRHGAQALGRQSVRGLQLSVEASCHLARRRKSNGWSDPVVWQATVVGCGVCSWGFVPRGCALRLNALSVGLSRWPVAFSVR